MTAVSEPTTASAAATSGGYRLTEEQLMLRDAVRVLADERIAPRAAEIDRTGEFPWDVKELLASHDILGLPFPAEYGGLGGELLTVCLAIEQISRACATSGLILAVHELGALPILLAGTDEQKQRWLPDLAAGRTLIAFALTEAEAGSDPAATRTRARRDGDDWIIDGAKRFISQGSVADLVTVFAVTDDNADTPRRRRLTCFVVEKDTQGFGVERIEHKMGIRGSPTAELSFRDVRVPDANRIGGEGEGFALAMRTFERSRPGIAAQAVGIAQGALEVAARYATERKQFGRPIAEFQMVGAMLADMDASTEAARQLLYKACTEIEAGATDAARWAAMCKLVAGDTAMRVTTDAVQVLGGYGYIDEFPVERMMRDAKITQLYEGTQQIQRLVIARALAGAASRG
ncbi:MAG TPA: acyl-CoA dehydrogenase family protein [Candidatus Limnocylindrales bacterium]|nr:acyl-CoA dehydrogenase family protein [Candidatus Limnocylindrales bacterium]